MKAFLLSAGLGTRLRPLTESMPKCLVPINGRPLLAYWLDLLIQHDIGHVLINTHHLAEQVARYVEGLSLPLRITLTYEPELLGSAGTVRSNWDFVDGEPDFFVLYADNLTNANLTQLLDEHRRRRKLATIGLFHAEHPEECGIVRLDADGTVVEFQEKPPRPASDLAFNGMIVGTPALRTAFPERDPSDLGLEVLPGLTGRIAGVELSGYCRDIGTLESYQQAERDVKKLEWPGA